MAGDWIKMRTDLSNDPAVIAIATSLGMDEDHVVGKLHRLWSWANKQTCDGNATGVTEKWIDRYLGVTGFAEAMKSSGWLSSESGGISIPKFGRHNGESAKQRALTAKRVAKHKLTQSALPREEKRRDIDSTNVESCPLPSANGHSTGIWFPVKDGDKWELPQRKLDEYQCNYGDRLDVVAEFRKAWQWLRDHKDRRKTKRGMAAFLTGWLNRNYDKTPPKAEKQEELMNDPEAVLVSETGQYVLPKEVRERREREAQEETI